MSSEQVEQAELVEIEKAVEACNAVAVPDCPSLQRWP
jgi:hypothetical protein